MAAEQDIEDKKGGISWGKVLAGAAIVSGAILGYAAFSPEISEALGKVADPNSGVLKATKDLVDSTGDHLRNGLASITGYKPEDFASITGTAAQPQVISNALQIPGQEATLGIAGVAKELGQSAYETAKAYPVATGATVAGVGVVGYGAKKWADRVSSRGSRDSYVAQLEAERTQGPGAPSRA